MCPSNKQIRVALFCVLVAHAGLLAWMAPRQSPTPDEVAHLPAGLFIWQYGRFDLYRVNPPLVKSLAALPVTLAAPRTDWTLAHSQKRPEFAIGTALIRANGEDAMWYFAIARWACIPLSLIGAWFCYLWAARLYGEESGLLAATLWCFSPNVLANAAMITPDAGASALGLAGCYAFWRWLEEPGWSRAIVAGVSLGILELTKTTWLILYAAWPLLWIVWLAFRKPPGPAVFKQSVQVAAIVAISLYAINLGYRFEKSFQRLGDFQFEMKSLSGLDAVGELPVPGNRFAGTWLGRLPVPLPADYVAGIDMQKSETDAGKLSYLRGEYSTQGWWYYYLYAVAIKEPLGSWMIFAMALVLSRLPRYSGGALNEITLLLPAAAIFLLVSAHTGLNRHLRYVLPAFPFVFVWMSKVARSIPLREKRVASLLGIGLAWSVGSSLSVYPHCLSYFNETVGGPLGGHRHLLGSNMDWGQDLLYLKEWAAGHPDAKPLYCNCGGLLPPSAYGIDSRGVPDIREPGWYAMSVNALHNRYGEYRDFARLKPEAVVGYTTYIYHLTPELIRESEEEDEGQPAGPP